MATYWENSCSFGLRYVSWYKYLIVSLVFSHLGFWNGNLFLIAPFPDLCLLVPFYYFRLVAFSPIMCLQPEKTRVKMTPGFIRLTIKRGLCGHQERIMFRETIFKVIIELLCQSLMRLTKT